MDRGARLVPWVLAFRSHHFFLVLLRGLCVLLVLGRHLNLEVLGHQHGLVRPLDPEDHYDLEFLEDLQPQGYLVIQ